MLDPRNGPAFDLPFQAAAQTYIIASTPRTGSTLLARSLWELGLGAPKEYFNPMQIRDWEVRMGTPWSSAWHARLNGDAVALAGRGHWPRHRVMAHLERVRRRRTQGGWFGMKVHRHHFTRFFPEPVEALLGPVTWIRIRREDRLAQAVSWAHALQSGRWVNTQTGRTAHYARRRIESRMRAIEAAEAGWDQFFTGRPVTTLTYEALVEGRVEVVLAALDSPGVAWPPAPLQRQQHAPDWAQRYLAGE